MGLHPIHKTTTVTVAILACAFLLAPWFEQTAAQEGPAEAALDIVENILQKTKKRPGGELGAWSREVIKRALERTGGNTPAPSAPLPAEEHAGRLIGGLTGRPSGPEVIIFMSLSAPEASLREWSREAARIGAPLVLRGLSPGGLQATVKRVGAYLARGSGAAIDPRLFRLFEIKVIPAVAVVPGGVPPCTSRSCTADPAPPHDRVIGNIGLEAALEAIAAEGGAGRAAARRHLETLRGEQP